MTIYLIAFFVFLDLITFSSANFLSKTFIVENPIESGQISKQERHFVSTQELIVEYLYSGDFRPPPLEEIKYLYEPWSANYLATLLDIGLISCHEPVSIGRRKVLGWSDEGYKGEVFLAGSYGEVNIKYWSPNRVEVEVSNLEKEDLLVLNQNYDDNWYVSTGGNSTKSENYNDLVAFRVEPGIEDVSFYYRYPTLQSIFSEP